MVSSATAWEIATKFRLGKLPDAEVVMSGFDGHLSSLGASQLSITVQHGLLAGSLQAGHNDPFDRMLAAQARIEGIRVVTNDPAFDDFEAATYW